MSPSTLSPPPPLELRNVTVRLGRPARAVVSDVSFTVGRGELVALVGPNGAGKSTLLSVAAGAVTPCSGAALLDGELLGSLSRTSIAQRVAVVAQSEALAFGFTVREVVAMGRAPHQGAWFRMSPADEEIVRESLLLAEIEELADRDASALSGGEQRRVALARALAQKPTVLLLDELTAPLDLRHQVQTMSLVLRLVRTTGLACIAVTHDLAQAARTADRIGLLNEGAIVRMGPPAGVLTEDVLADVFRIDLRVGTDFATGLRYVVPFADL